MADFGFVFEESRARTRPVPSLSKAALVGGKIDLADIAGELGAVGPRDAHIAVEDGDVAVDVVDRVIGARDIVGGDDDDVAAGRHGVKLAFAVRQIAEFGGHHVAFDMAVAANSHRMAARDRDFLVFPIFQRVRRGDGFRGGLVFEALAGYIGDMLVEIIDAVIAVNVRFRGRDMHVAVAGNLVDIAAAGVGRFGNGFVGCRCGGRSSRRWRIFRNRLIGRLRSGAGFRRLFAFMRAQKIGFNGHIAAHGLGVAAGDVKPRVFVPFEAFVGGDFDMTGAGTAGRLFRRGVTLGQRQRRKTENQPAAQGACSKVAYR